ncbi:hypothetical protein DFP72DRAFT_1164876 [Ephemerocybe angulata]|uniref:Uncharacterized protein n=1 Tax=Ephemerocybe angulata TaxID=980116 RepID=A0A8H6IAM6_9AGAR|nr:hypothetical protein DFP72DRAFT_1164876 [Tulosesus angulatus]
MEPGSIHRHICSFRELSLFYTSFPTSKKRLHLLLNENDALDREIRPLVEAIDYWEASLSRLPEPWGTYDPRAALLDGNNSTMPSKSPDLTWNTEQIPPSVSSKLVAYTTALGLCDILKLRARGPNLRERIVRHARRPGWIGNSKVCSHSLRVSVNRVRCEHESFIVSALEPATTAKDALDPTIRLANEIMSVELTSENAHIVHNFATIAFAISVMLKGYLEVPENLRLQTFGDTASLQTVLRRAAQYRRPLQLAVGYTILIAFADMMLSKDLLQYSDILLNTKRRGSDKPASIQRLELDTWDAVMSIVHGEVTPLQAYRSLMARWRQEKAIESLTEDESNFFAGDASIKAPRPPHLDHMFFTVLAEPLAPEVSLPKAALRHAHLLGSVSPTQYTLAIPAAPSANVGKENTSPVAPVGAQELHVTVPARPAANAPLSRIPLQESTGSSSVGQRGASVSDEDERAACANGAARKRTGPPPLASIGPRKSARLSTHQASASSSSAQPVSYAEAQVRRKSKKVAKGNESTNALNRIREPIDYHALIAQDKEALESLRSKLGLPSVLNAVKAPRINLEGPVNRYRPEHPVRIEAWDADRKRHEIELVFSTEEDNDTWGLIAAAELNCRVETDDGPLPLFIVGRGQKKAGRKSAFHLIPYSNSDKPDDAAQVQSLLRGRPVIVASGNKQLIVPWNFRSMESVVDAEKDVEIRDLSLAVPRDGSARVRSGTLRDVCYAGLLPLQNRRPLNAVNIPKHTSCGLPETPEDSGIRALHRTCDDHGCSKALPADSLRFGSVATTGAHELWQIAGHGFGTAIEVAIGRRLLVVATPKDERLSSSLNLWSDEDLNNAMLDLSRCHVETIVAQAGDKVIMQPNTAYASYTIDNTLCHGGYFLATSTLQLSIHGAIHAFFNSRSSTSFGHHVFEQQMNSLAAFFYRTLVLGDARELDEGHIPDVSTPQGLEDLIRFACGIFTLTIITPSTYMVTEDVALIRALEKAGVSLEEALDKYDISKTSYENRRQTVINRGRIIATLKHVFAKLTVQCGDRTLLDPWKDLFIPSLAWLLYALEDYHDRSTRSRQSTQNESNFLPSKEQFDRHIISAANQWPELLKGLSELKEQQDVVDSTEWIFPPDLHVSAKPLNAHVELQTRSEVYECGFSVLDTLYFYNRERYLKM